jgi:predicted AlkP superfamily pyrophosphatase or phosphodiesterase
MRRFLILMAAAAVALSFNSCNNDKAVKPKADHVIFIALDGWATQSFKDNVDNMPTVKMLMENGCYTMHKRSTMPSSSATNWATIFMGVPPEMHGYNAWNSREPAIDPYAVGKNGMPETVYTLMNEQRPDAESVCIFNWDGIGYVVDSAAITYNHYDPGYHNADDTDYSIINYTRREAIKYLSENKPDFFTFYIGDVDEVGHRCGWESEEYQQCLAETDAAIAEIIQTLKDRKMYKNSIIVVSSDHGGKVKGHGGFTLPEMETPFVICGKNIAKRGEFPEFMMQYDLAATLAKALGLRIPEVWRGRPMPVFEE